MIVGVPKEIKDQEFRVSLVPPGARTLVDGGHRVVVQAGAGEGSGIPDEAYREAGAEVLPDISTVYERAEMIVKVKEPQHSECQLLRSGQMLFTFLHLAPLPALTEALVERRVTGIAYETIQDADGSLPVLVPMSEVAGRMAIQVGAHYLESARGGRGVLLGGVPGVPPGEIVILGGGVVGLNAAKLALGIGGRVIILELSPARMRHVDDLFGGRVATLQSNPSNIAAATARADLLIGAVLITGASAPKLVTREMVSTMKPGSVVVDVAVDQGGCVETTRVTTHREPTFEVDGVLHYGVANMPGAVPRTSTFALTNATFTYVHSLADRGFRGAMESDPSLRRGVNVYDGNITFEAVAIAQGKSYTALEGIL